MKKEKKEWYPVIDESKCTSCLACVDMCTHGVYAIEDNKPRVVNKDACVFGCTGCDNECPANAITHRGENEK